MMMLNIKTNDGNERSWLRALLFVPHAGLGVWNWMPLLYSQ